MLKKFVITLIVFAIPFILLLTPYFVGDPFKVLYSYDSYVEEGKPMYININRGYVSTEMFAKYNKKYHYDSFIFGSSRSGYFRSYDWSKYLPDTASIFHFDGYGESLYQIYIKLKYIEGKSQINNALICVDKDLLFKVDPYYTPLHSTPPRLINYENYFSFQSTYIKAYMNPKFLRIYLDLFFFRKVKPYMISAGIIDTTPYIYNIKCNEAGERLYRDSIDSSYYNKSRLLEFYERPLCQVIDSNNYILSKNKAMLLEIKEILERNNTSYKIIINPHYNQLKLSLQDYQILYDIFGKKLYDFSGINKYTNDIYNYVDPAHFKNYISADIMRIIYEQDSLKQKQMIDSIYDILQ